MKAYLKTDSEIFQLAPKITTIGRDGCDLIVQSHGVDFQHAVLEFSNPENCFVLQDLNSSQGTFVNNCRVQNAAVRLSEGDVLRFGNSAMCFEFTTNFTTVTSCPPVKQRKSWNGSITLVPEDNVNMKVGLPNLGNLPFRKSTQSPFSAEKRPFSAGSLGVRSSKSVAIQKISFGRPTSGVSKLNIQETGFEPSVPQDYKEPETGEEQVFENLKVQISSLTRELESANQMLQDKDTLVQRLRSEVQDLQMQLRQVQIRQSQMFLPTPPNSQSAYKAQVNVPEVEITLSNESSNTRSEELENLRIELDHLRKDKIVMSGLVTQMQKDMLNKDTTIGRMSRDIEKMKAEMLEKDNKLVTLESKVHIQENSGNLEEIEGKEKELRICKHKFKKLEEQFDEMCGLVKKLEADMQDTKAKWSEEKDKRIKGEKSLEKCRSENQDIERVEKQTRIDMEEYKKKYQQFKQEIVKVVFQGAGKKPNAEFKEETLIEEIKKHVKKA